MCSDCVQSVFRVCSECVQSMFNIEIISSPSASSVSIFGIFTSRLSDFQVRVDAGDARRQELGTAPATSKVVVRIQ